MAPQSLGTLTREEFNTIKSVLPILGWSVTIAYKQDKVDHLLIDVFDSDGKLYAFFDTPFAA